MENLYNRNGLLFWTEEEIELRDYFEKQIKNSLYQNLLKQNSAFHIVKIEAPILTPKDLINPNYSAEDYYQVEDLVLRPETTMGSYEAAKILLSPHDGVKYKLPLIVYQHGKSFRKEQDQPTKFMRLKEFYQLEFQIIYSANTMNDYFEKLMFDLQCSLLNMVGYCRIEKSDRLPSYSEMTMDFILDKSNMEICSMSKRKDFEDKKVIEVAFGTDRLVYNYLNTNKIKV